MKVPKIRFWGEGVLSRSRLRRLCSLRPGSLGSRHDSARWLRSIISTLEVASDVLEQSAGQARGLALSILSEVMTVDQAMALVYGVHYTHMVAKLSDFHGVAITRANLREASDAFRRDIQSAIRAAVQIPFTVGDIVGRYTGLHADRFFVDDPNDLSSAREHARTFETPQRPQPQADRVDRVV